MRLTDRLTSGRLGGFLAIALGVAILPFAGKPAQAADDSCVSHAIDAERELNIPAGLLVAVSLVESGQDGAPSPFAMSVQGRAIFARSVKDASRLLRDSRGNFRSNTFVGCMQLSLSHHRGQFEPVERIVEPRENVWYAGRMLLRLHGEEGNWRSALARYNGGSMRTAQNYVCKVWQHLSELDARSARLIETAACEDGTPAIAPKTRRTFRNGQVAALN